MPNVDKNLIQLLMGLQQPAEAAIPSPLMAPQMAPKVGGNPSFAANPRMSTSVKTTVRQSPNVLSFGKQLDDQFYNQMGQRNDQVKQMQTQQHELEAQPKTFADVNLRPAMAWADSLVGTQIADDYKAPAGEEGRKAQVAKLQESIMRQQNNIGDDQLAYLKQKASEESLNAREQRSNSLLSRSMLANEFKLRNEWDGDPITKNTKGVSEGWQKIQSAGNNVRDPATYLTMVYGLMRMQDPASTVRESEFKTGEGIGGWPEQWKVAFQKATGDVKGGITDTQIQAIMQQANNIKEAQLSRQRLVDTKYKSMAEEYGFSPGRVVLDDIFKDPASEFVTVAKGTEKFQIAKNDQAALQEAIGEGFQVVK